MQVHLSNYVNTIIFCILASSFSLIMLVVMYNAPSLVPFLLTAELGLLGVVIYLVATLLNTAVDSSSEVNSYFEPKDLSSCPDYFTMEGNKDNAQCTNPRTNGVYLYSKGSPQVSLKALQSMAGSDDVCAWLKANDNVPWTDLKGACVEKW